MVINIILHKVGVKGILSEYSVAVGDEFYLHII